MRANPINLPTEPTPERQRIIDCLPCPVFFKDASGCYTGCNEAFAETIIGIPREHIIGKSIAELTEQIPPEHATTYVDHDKTLMAQGGTQTYEAPVTCADGTIRQFAFHKSVIRNPKGKIEGIAGVMLDVTAAKRSQLRLDQYRCKLEETVSKRSAELMATNTRLAEEITERKKVELALQASEERYRRVFENTGNATILIESDMTISMANQRAEKLAGMPRDQFLGKAKMVDFVAPADRDRIQLYHELRVKGEEEVPNQFEFQIVDASGTLRDILASVQYVPETRQTVASLMDITRNNALQRERQQLAAVIDQSEEAVIITDKHGSVEYVNRAFEMLSGFKREECLGQTSEAIFLAEEDRKIFGQMTFMVSGDDSWNGRVKNIRKNGTLYIADTRIFPICDEKGQALNLVCVKKDVTHEIQLEKQLQQAQKMEAIGTLAGGIAHDFNNILGGILGYAEISLLKSDHDEGLKHSLGRILDGCQRAKELVQNILTFSRKNDEEAKPIEIQVIIKEALKLLRASIPSTIEFKQHICKESSIVHTTPTHIHQVVMNLCTNAAHAMIKTGGILEIGLQNIEMTAENSGDHAEALPGPYAVLTVRDSGSGMDAQTLERIFEPYFTTKEQTGGTGLGLAMVHGIVKNCGGSITVSSQTGSGTCFTIYLPRVENAASANTTAKAELPKGKERILVADDEQFILEIMSDMLGSLGYEVATANSGLDALQQFNANPDRFDLVIADLTMPKITGKQLAQKIKQVRSELPIILTTGMNFDLQSENSAFEEFAAVLSKPILYSDLAKTLRAALDTQ